MILKVTSRIVRWGRLLFLPRFGCSRSHLPARKKLSTALVSTGILFVSLFHAAHAVQLSSDIQLATAGYYQLLWSGNSKVFQLQESQSADFISYKVIYEGNDLARVISGKPDGEYFYRISASAEKNSVTSNVVKITVVHHPLENAVLFFIAGAIVFIGILGLIIKGNRQGY
jgi:hypothetical protein